MKRLITPIAIVALLVTGCGHGDAGTTTSTRDGGSVIAEFETPDGETYRVLLTGDAAETARRAFAAGENPGIPNGRIRPGDGGINAGHDWHIEDVEFADMAIEVCDGTVSYIDDLGFEEYTAQHGDRYCPWDADLVDLADD